VRLYFIHSKTLRAMAKYRHIETGEIKSVSSSRTYINPDCSKRCVNLDDGSSLDDWELLDFLTDYSSIATKKAPGDGHGLR
jgi:hypothetical protein